MNPYFYIAKNPDYGKKQKPYKEPTQEEFERLRELLGEDFKVSGWRKLETLEDLIRYSKTIYDNNEPQETIVKSVNLCITKDVTLKDAAKEVMQRDDFIKWDSPY